MAKVHDVIIIGGGCAGLTAGIYCARAELEPLVFTGVLSDKGGLLTKTSIVENYPGFPDGVQGLELVEAMEKQAINCGAKIIDSEIKYVDFASKPFKLIDSENNTYYTHSVIIATGSKPNKLGLSNEDLIKGVSSCAVCDGALYKKKKIMVVGGGDSAMEEAEFLTKYSNVTLVHRRSEFRASKAMQKKVLSNPKIRILYKTEIKELRAQNEKLSKVLLVNVETGEEFLEDVQGLFYGLGLKPNTLLFKTSLELDDEGYIKKNSVDKYETMTSVEGVFVAGDASDKIYRQAIVASGDGCRAALDVNKYLSEMSHS